MLYFTSALKQIRQKKLFFLLMLFFITSTIFLVSTFIFLYITSYRDLKEIKSKIPVHLTLSTQAENNDTIRFPYETFSNSGYFQAADSNLYLMGTIDSHIRLPHETDWKNKKIDDNFFFQGIIKGYEKSNSGYLVNIYISKHLWGNIEDKKEHRFLLYDKVSSQLLDMLLSQELYLMASHGDIRDILDERSITDPITVEHNKLFQSLNPSYYSYMGELEHMNTSKFSYPLLYTHNITNYEPFLNKAYYLYEGDFFTEEDYETQNKVCMIPLELAKRYGYSIGDNIQVRKADVHVSSNLASPHYYTCGPFTNDYTNIHLNYVKTNTLDNTMTLEKSGQQEFIQHILDTQRNTYKDYLHTDAISYKIVGIYTNSNSNTNPYYYMNPNTIIIADNRTLHDSSLDESFFSHYNLNSFTFTFTNQDSKDEFFEYLSREKFDFTKYTIHIHDNGYYQLYDTFRAINNAASLLLIISFVAFLILLFLFMYFYFESSKRIYILDRILGNTKSRSKRSTSYAAHMIFILSIGISFLGNILSINHIIHLFYKDSLKDSNTTEIMNHNLAINSLPYILIILSFIYIIVYYIFQTRYTKKSLIKLVTDKDNE